MIECNTPQRSSFCTICSTSSATRCTCYGTRDIGATCGYRVLVPPVEQALPGESPGAALRRLREHASHSVREVADALGWSSSKLSRIETATSGIKSDDLARLLDFYEAPDEVRDSITALGPQSGRRSSRSSDALPDAYATYTRFEAQASRISTYAAVVIPGLLQTPEYASAILNAAIPQERPYATPRLETRMVRQAILGREPPVQIDAIIDEAALGRPIGGPDVIRRQALRLQELNDRPEITIRILPFAVGAHPALTGPFAILEFPDEMGVPPHVFCDGLIGGVLRNEGDDVTRYQACYTALEELALSTGQSALIFAEMAERHPL